MGTSSLQSLPDFLTADDGGFVHVAGSRIGLHHVVRLYREGGSPELIAVHYPTLPLSMIHKVIAFYLDNQQAVTTYVDEQDREVARQASVAGTSPSLTDLRSRLASRSVVPGRQGTTA